MLSDVSIAMGQLALPPTSSANADVHQVHERQRDQRASIRVRISLDSLQDAVHTKANYWALAAVIPIVIIVLSLKNIAAVAFDF